MGLAGVLACHAVGPVGISFLSGSLRPPRSPNIIWPSLSSIIIHYGRQWPEMLTRPKTSNIHTVHTIEIDNRWMVTYSPMLSQIFQTHINVEPFISVKYIKCIYKYINKGRDQAIFVLRNEHDETKEVTIWEVYTVSTSEAVWRILPFPTHELFSPSSVVRKTILLKLCCTKKCPDITRLANYLKCLFWINYFIVCTVQ